MTSVESQALFIDDGSKKSKELFLEYKLSDKKFIYLKYLDWDTEFFSKQSFLLDMNKSNFVPSEDLKNELSNNLLDSFISVKINTKIDFEYMNFLQECGFKYIDTEIQLKHNGLHVHTESDIMVQKLFINENLPYDDLGSSFNLTRFHTDLNISNKKADLLWIEYLKNFKPDENKFLYIAKFNKKIVGIALVNKVDNDANLFFIAVLDGYRGLGIGKQLMDTVVFNFKDIKIHTETQVKNIKALNFYLQNGFYVENSFSVLHKWRNNESS